MARDSYVAHYDKQLQLREVMMFDAQTELHAVVKSKNPFKMHRFEVNNAVRTLCLKTDNSKHLAEYASVL